MKTWRHQMRIEAEQAILNGPDGPAKRFLLEVVKRREAAAGIKPFPAVAADNPKLQVFAERELPPADHANQTDEEFFTNNPVEADDEPWERG